MSGQRVGLFVQDLAAGGAERVMVHLAAGLAEQGLGVDLVLVQRRGVFLPLVPPKVRIVDLKARRVRYSVPALARYLWSERPTVLISALVQDNVAALLARRLSGVPVRVIVREDTFVSVARRHQPNLTIRLAFRLLPLVYRWADAVVAVSQAVADDLARASGLPRERICTIYNPVVTPELPAMAAQPVDHPWFVPGQPPVVLAAGRLNRVKDFATLIRAFAHLRRHRPARLLIVGEGNQRPALEQLVGRLGLDQDVDMPGHVDNPFPYMARASVFALSSRWEGLGNVLIEAMACGTPVVATDCPGGPREILADGQFGKLVPVGNAEVLAEALEQTLAQPPDPDPARRRAGDFSLERSVTEHMCLLVGTDRLLLQESCR